MTLLDKKAAAGILGISTVTLDRLRQAGQLPYRKIGALVRFLPEDIESFVRMAGVPAKDTKNREVSKYPQAPEGRYEP
jgi:predicted DNA-binding transcriptional regulator AlpA